MTKEIMNSPIKFLCYRKNARGFTLLEVMVALAVVAGLLTTLLYTVSFHLDIAGRHENMTRAALLARAKIAEMRSEAQKGNGTFDPPNEDFKWSVELRNVQTPYGDIPEVTVKVTGAGETVVLKNMVRVE